jgi:hypothetical protein
MARSTAQNIDYRERAKREPRERGLNSILKSSKGHAHEGTMPTEMGEYLVGAYLKLVFECSVVDYDARPAGGGLQGLGELDVIGFDFVGRNAYLCEVTTHLDGLLTHLTDLHFTSYPQERPTPVPDLSIIADETVQYLIDTITPITNPR